MIFVYQILYPPPCRSLRRHMCVYGLMTKLPSSSFQTSKPSKPSSFRSLLSKPPSAASFLILILLLRRFLLGTSRPISRGDSGWLGNTRVAPTHLDGLFSLPSRASSLQFRPKKIHQNFDWFFIGFLMMLAPKMIQKSSPNRRKIAFKPGSQKCLFFSLFIDFSSISIPAHHQKTYKNFSVL